MAATVLVTVGPCVMTAEEEEAVTGAGAMAPMSSNQCKMQVNKRILNIIDYKLLYSADFDFDLRWRLSFSVRVQMHVFGHRLWL